MTLNQILYFRKVARLENYHQAAEELYISQPTLTKHLQKLEREMGTKLFSRSGNSYTPTFAGRKYMQYARKILQIRQDWEKELKDLTENNEGELNVAFPLMRSTCMVPQIMTSFFQKYPKVKVNILEEAYSIQEKLLLNDQLDFGIFNEVHKHPKLEYELLKKEEMIEKEIERVEHTNVGTTEAVQALLESYESTPLTSGTTLAELIRRPELSYEKIAPIDKHREELPYDVKEQVDINIKYDGYIKRQMRQVEQFKKLENKRIPENINYDEIQSLRLEAKQKLNKIRPSSIGQASRISGVSPADVSVLLVYLSSK